MPLARPDQLQLKRERYDLRSSDVLCFCINQANEVDPERETAGAAS